MAVGAWLPGLLALAVCGGVVAALSVTGNAGASSNGETLIDGEYEVLAEMPATGNDLRATQAHNSPQLAVDPTNEDVVALANRLDKPDFSCALQLSGDGGRQWAPVEPVPQIPEGGEKCYAPEIAFDSDGTLYYLFVALAGGGNRPVGVYLTTSEDLGRTFSEPRQLLGAGNYQVRMALDRNAGRIHLVWLQSSGEPGLGACRPRPTRSWRPTPTTAARPSLIPSRCPRANVSGRWPPLWRWAPTGRCTWSTTTYETTRATTKASRGRYGQTPGHWFIRCHTTGGSRSSPPWSSTTSSSPPSG